MNYNYHAKRKYKIWITCNFEKEGYYYNIMIEHNRQENTTNINWIIKRQVLSIEGNRELGKDIEVQELPGQKEIITNCIQYINNKQL